MRLLHVMATAPHGGAEAVMLDSVLALSGVSGLKQYIVTRDNNDRRLERIADAGIAYATTNLNPSLPALSRYKLARTIDRFCPDVIQYWKARAGRFTYTRHRERSFAWHGGTARSHRLGGCGWHQGSSVNVIADLLDSGIREDRAFVVPPFCEDIPPHGLKKSDFGIPDAAPLGIVLSRLHAKKGLTVLIDAVKIVEGLHILIAGDGPMRRALRAQLHAQRLENRVHLLGWREDYRALIDISDFVVSPSRIEPFGKSVLEAWSAGRPIIAADAKGPATLITPGKTGLLVKRGDDEALAGAIQTLIANPALAETMANAAREAYCTDFGRPQFIQDMMDIYTRIKNAAGPFGTK